MSYLPSVTCSAATAISRGRRGNSVRRPSQVRPFAHDVFPFALPEPFGTLGLFSTDTGEESINEPSLSMQERIGPPHLHHHPSPAARRQMGLLRNSAGHAILLLADCALLLVILASGKLLESIT